VAQEHSRLALDAAHGSSALLRRAAESAAASVAAGSSLTASGNVLGVSGPPPAVGVAVVPNHPAPALKKRRTQAQVGGIPVSASDVSDAAAAAAVAATSAAGPLTHMVGANSGTLAEQQRHQLAVASVAAQHQFSVRGQQQLLQQQQQLQQRQHAFFDSAQHNTRDLTTAGAQSGGNYFFTSDDCRIFYEEKGTGIPLILIHGWSGSSRLFVRNFDYLAQHFRVIRYDLRGHGQSETTSQGFHVARFAADLLNLMDHLRLDRVALLGCSLGCAVIWSYVELFGTQRLSAAMFVDQSPWQLYAPDGSWRLGSNGMFSAASISHLAASLALDPRGCHVGTVKWYVNQIIY
jgi:hypothetical protein